MTKVTKMLTHTAVPLISGVLLAAIFLGGFPGVASTHHDVEQTSSTSSDRCAGGTQVSSFICRNTWMASGKFSAR
jgi:hypothetical protein